MKNSRSDIMDLQNFRNLGHDINFRLRKREKYKEFLKSLYPNEPHFYPVCLTKIVISCYNKIKSKYPDVSNEAAIELGIDDFLDLLDRNVIGYIPCSRAEHQSYHIGRPVQEDLIVGNYKTYGKEYSEYLERIFI